MSASASRIFILNAVKTLKAGLGSGVFLRLGLGAALVGSLGVVVVLGVGVRGVGPVPTAFADQLVSREEPESFSIHIIDDRTPTLMEASVFLYGTTRGYLEIARWNSIPPPYPVRQGQRLKIRRQLKLSSRTFDLLPKEQGERSLLGMWRKRFGLADSDLRPVDLHPVNSEYQKLSQEYEAELVEAAAFQGDSVQGDSVQGDSVQGDSVQGDSVQGDSVQEQSPEHGASSRAPDQEASLRTPQTIPALLARSSRENGRRRFEAGDFAGAVVDFAKARELEPEELSSWFYGIRALRELKRHEEARELIRQFLEKRPELGVHPFLSVSPEETSP